MTTASGLPVVGIVGWKNSGKTTLAERLIEHFTRRGFKVASVKHTHHDFSLDRAGTDSARHRSAGATEVALVGPNQWALLHDLRDETPSLVEILARLSPCDLVIVEGFKTAPIPKIEVRRAAQSDRRPLEDPAIIAIAADHAVPSATVPVHHLDDITGLAGLISRTLGLDT